VAITNFHAGETFGVRVVSLLDVAKEFQFAIGERFSVGVELGETQFAIAILRARQKQYAISKAAPCLGVWSAVVSKKHHTHTRFLRGGQHFLSRAFGMVRVLGVNVNDGSVILINTEIREFDALARETLPGFVYGFKLFWLGPLLRR
jgi:hypothetical protein